MAQNDAPHLVLITGASSGIGRAIAQEFAAQGHPVVLVARRKEKLEELARQITRDTGLPAHVVTADLGVKEGPEELVKELLRRELQVDVLVNNAGIGQHGPFAHSEMQTMEQLLQLNIVSLTELTRRLLPGMLERGRGGILNVGSTAGFQPGPNMAIYYASKAYVYSFTEALAQELAGTPLFVTNLAPGATTTEFQDKAQIADMVLFSDTVLFSTGVMDAQTVAKAGVKGVKEGRTLVVPGLKNKLGALGAPFVPRALMRKLMAKVNSKT